MNEQNIKKWKQYTKNKRFLQSTFLEFVLKAKRCTLKQPDPLTRKTRKSFFKFGLHRWHNTCAIQPKYVIKELSHTLRRLDSKHENELKSRVMEHTFIIVKLQKLSSSNSYLQKGAIFLEVRLFSPVVDQSLKDIYLHSLLQRILVWYMGNKLKRRWRVLLYKELLGTATQAKLSLYVFVQLFFDRSPIYVRST